jgi:hypothetical protein
MLDSTIFTEVPPLRAMWAPVGEQACVAITGDHDKRILTGVLNLKTGAYLQYFSAVYTKTFFRTSCVSSAAIGVAGTSSCFWIVPKCIAPIAAVNSHTNWRLKCAGSPKPARN